ncbi:MAG: POTRA domain-containing protein, partial [Verrucomicrobiota bacterium]
MRIVNTILTLMLSLGSMLLSFTAHAQNQEPAADADYPQVDGIRIEFDGFQAVSDEYVMSNIRIREGMDYNPALVDQSIRSLYGTGYFEFVEIKVESAGEDSVEVIVDLVSKYLIRQIRFNG